MITAKTIRRNCKIEIKDRNTFINTGHNRYQVIKVAFYTIRIDLLQTQYSSHRRICLLKMEKSPAGIMFNINPPQHDSQSVGVSFMEWRASSG